MEAFSLAHQVSASTVGAPAAARLAVAGIQFERIFEDLRVILSEPTRPLVAILGGTLSLNKLLLAERIAARADTVLVGGELALAFHKAGPAGWCRIRSRCGRGGCGAGIGRIALSV